jgi:hypothetical protein
MQDFTITAAGQQQNQQELVTLQAQARARGEVFPYDKVTVYATAMLVKSNYVHDINKVGQPMEVHPALAEKLIEQGKATKEAPAPAQPAPTAEAKK